MGRRIKCKKCGTPLIVTEAGLEVDDPDAAPRPEPVPPAADAADNFDEDEDDRPRRGRGRDRGRRAAGPGFNPMEALAKVGGIPTLLFGFGAFLVIVFLFMPIIGNAAVERAAAGKEKLEQERDSKIKRLVPKGKRVEDLTTDERKKYDEDAEKIRKDYEKQIGDAEEDARLERVNNRRSRWFEMYGMMFGFLFLMIGSIGYMMPGQSTARRVLGTIVLAAQMVFMIIEIVLVSGIMSFGRG